MKLKMTVTDKLTYPLYINLINCIIYTFQVWFFYFPTSTLCWLRSRFKSTTVCLNQHQAP